MKKVLCANNNCDQRRIHHEDQDTMRPTRECEVPDDYEGISFCSITCACMAGYYSVKSGWLKDPTLAIKKE